MTVYPVQSGDKLSIIAQNFGVTVAAIMKANPIIKDANVIKVGWMLNIPTPEDKQPATGTPAANPPYKKIGKRVLAILDKIEELPEFKQLMEMIE